MASLKYVSDTNLMTVTLGSNYTAGDGHMHLTTGHGSRLPSAGDFWLRTSSGTYRCFKVTERTDDTITVTAAQDGTSDGNLDSGAELKWVLGGAAFDQFRADLTQTGAYGSLPSAEKAGNLYLPTDGVRLYRDSGAAQVPWGPVFPLTNTPAANTFTAVNGAAGATLTDSQGGLYLKCDAAGGVNKRLWVVAQPARPYTITIAAMVRLIAGTYTGFGLGWRDSNSGSLVLFGPSENAASTWSPYLSIAKWTNPTTYSASYSSSGFRCNAPLLWLRITDTGTNFQVFHSVNGITWEQFDQDRSRTDFLAAPDQWCVWAENQTSTKDVYAYILSLVQS